MMELGAFFCGYLKKKKRINSQNSSKYFLNEAND